MKNDKNRKKGGVTPIFTNIAILDDTSRTADTNAAIPSEQAVKEAKDWVDYNKK